MKGVILLLPKLSIIVTVYNLENYIINCLNSIINQTRFFDSQIEIIVIDDGSSDNSPTIIKQYLKKLEFDKQKSIQYFYKGNGGLSEARNFGLINAKGEFVLYVDGDDTLSANFIEAVFPILEKNEIDILIFDFFKVFQENKIRMNSIKNCANHITQREYLLGIPCAWNKIVRRELLINNKLFFPKGIWYEDLALTPQYCLYTNKIFYLKEPLINYIFRENSIINKKEYNDKFEDIFKVVSILISSFKESGYQKELEFIIVSQLMYHSADRFLSYSKTNQLLKSIEIVKINFPNWKKNDYFKISKSVFLITRLVYYKCFRVSGYLFKKLHKY